MIDSRTDTKFADFLQTQKLFNDAVYGEIKDINKEEVTKTLALSLHSEVSSIVSSINFKDHTSHRIQINNDKLLYESVDAFRYILALLNTWDITGEQFCNAFNDKDAYLWIRRECEKESWAGQDVVLVDIDDVLAEFRVGFYRWVLNTYGIDIDINSKEYYTTKPVLDKGVNPEEVFQRFLAQGGMSRLPVVNGCGYFLDSLIRRGYWVHLLTARPEDNPRCFYDTFLWLRSIGLPFNRVSFAPEKFRWTTQTQYYGKCRIIAVDDSPKHSAEYAKHGIEVLSPVQPYNGEIAGLHGVHMYRDFEEALKILDEINPAKTL